MSKIFGIHFAVHSEAGQLHQWSPGDEVPEWVEPLVGDHCLLLPHEEPEDADADEDEESTPIESDSDAAAEDATPETPAADAAPDFTKPAARRGRTPKQA